MARLLFAFTVLALGCSTVIRLWQGYYTSWFELLVPVGGGALATWALIAETSRRRRRNAAPPMTPTAASDSDDDGGSRDDEPSHGDGAGEDEKADGNGGERDK